MAILSFRAGMAIGYSQSSLEIVTAMIRGLRDMPCGTFARTGWRSHSPAGHIPQPDHSKRSATNDRLAKAGGRNCNGTYYRLLKFSMQLSKFAK